MIIQNKYWKVGELANQTGLTVRTLHHYDKIGLFSPSRHTDTGHRLYTEEDIAKLQQIMSFKHLGFSLEEIKELIENQSFNPSEVIRLYLERLNEHIRIQEELRSQLENLYTLVNSQQQVKVEQFINLIEVINMNVEKYFTQEQLVKMKKQTEQFNQSPEEKIQAVKEYINGNDGGKTIANSIGVHPSLLHQWIKHYEQLGLEDLMKLQRKWKM
ncbi:DNA-binding transcriptional MerR regulator [Neobacillus ginsengisoli]|uniref:DNA-binding transcriptional MerR regulator n=1 Tax=Neobacillus ginsengisoli TaxID=904295 RepID=A0ABT9Y377_9BACI|nr:DNA-binding transcriptional MerR regulator [Neobacillus ginsengisoli]